MDQDEDGCLQQIIFSRWQVLIGVWIGVQADVVVDRFLAGEEKPENSGSRALGTLVQVCCKLTRFEVAGVVALIVPHAVHGLQSYIISYM